MPSYMCGKKCKINKLWDIDMRKSDLLLKGRITLWMIVLGAILLSNPFCLQAQDLVYTPINPAFGGMTYNYQWLLSSANAQNTHQASSGSFYSTNPFDNFTQSLQSQILSELAQEIVQSRFGNLDLNQKGKYDLGSFIINIVPGLSGIDITVFNKNSGDQSTITIPRY